MPAVWPLARYITYVNGTIVTPADLNNEIQDAIVGLYTGNLSLTELTVDGVGGVAGTATPGSIVTSANITAGGNISAVGGAFSGALSVTGSAVCGDVIANSFVQTAETLLLNVGSNNDTPLQIAFGYGSHIRSIIDHNGYIMGRNTVFQENWSYDINENGAAAGIRLGPWFYDVTSGAFSATGNFGQAIDPIINAPFVLFNSGFDAVGKQATLRSGPLFMFASHQSADYEWEQNPFNYSHNPGGQQFGFFDTNFSNSSILLTLNSSGVYTIAFKLSGTTISTATAATGSGAWDRIRMELHGSGSPYGEVCRVFINESLTTIALTGITAASASGPMYWGMYFTAITADTSNTPAIRIGPIHGVTNRYLSPAAL